MQANVPAAQAAAFAAVVAWFYLITNSARLITYVPQIVAVWRCRDGARSISLLTWGSWTVSHFAAILYGIVVVPDLFFVCVSLVNLLSCAVVTAIVVRRRYQLRQASRAARGPQAGAPIGATQTQLIRGEA
jgi:uncharacterized protein with PQ loop repeat